MESFDSLLTCCICLDRYRNPKLLPCQHSFCMEPCMEGLIDYVKRQIKCPECRAEHRIPYKGIQEFPNNVTLQRFLDMYHVISGELPDPNQGQIMERCNICNEKDYLQHCAHCEKRVCPECKSSHVDVLKREVARINSQIRRGIHRLKDVHQSLEKNSSTMKQNCLAVHEEVDQIGQRLIRAIKGRTEFLKSEVEGHMDTEIRSMDTLRNNLELEISNIESNADLVEKHMLDQSEWDDCELMDTKDIFLKTVEFIRNFEHDQSGTGDYRRPIRFSVIQDPNSLSKTLEHFGELNIAKKDFSDPQITISGSNCLGMNGPGLMRSKSDHRLVAQVRNVEERGYGGFMDELSCPSPIGRRRFGERTSRKENDAGLHGDEGSPYESPCERRQKYRSRCTRKNLDMDGESDSNRPDAFVPQETSTRDKKERTKVIDTDDASRGPISGITRIADVPHVMQKLADLNRNVNKKPAVKSVEPPPAPVPVQPAAPWRRKKSEEDEISQIKKQNKETELRGATGSDEPQPLRAPSSYRSSAERNVSLTTALPKAKGLPEESGSETEDSLHRRSRVSRPSIDESISEGTAEAPDSRRASQSVSASKKPNEPAAKVSIRAPVSRSSSNGSVGQREAHASLGAQWEKRVSRSNSSDSAASDSSTSNSKRRTGAMFSTTELKNRFQSGYQPSEPAQTRSVTSANGRTPTSASLRTNGADTSASAAASSRPRFQSRFLGRPSTPKAGLSKESASSDDSSSDSDSDSSSSDSESEHALVSAHDVVRPRGSETMAKTSIGPLLARSAQARSSASDSPHTSSSPITTGANGVHPRRSSFYGTRHDSEEVPPLSGLPDRYTSRYETGIDSKQFEPRYSNRYGDYASSNGLMRSRTSSHLETRSSGADDPYSSYSSKYGRSSRPSLDDYPSHSRYSSYSSRFLNRSKSSAAIEEPEDAAGHSSPAVADSAAVASDADHATGKSRYVSKFENRPWVARSRSSEGNDESTPGSVASSPQQPPVIDDAGNGLPGAASKSEALSSWAQYLKNKYSHRKKDDKEKGKVGFWNMSHFRAS